MRLRGFALAAVLACSNKTPTPSPTPVASSSIPIAKGPPPPPVTSISARDYNTCVIRSGRIYCWGVGFQGSWHAAPRAVRIGELEHVSAVSVGGQFACAIEDGDAWCWGYNGFGEVGDGTEVERLAPVRVKGLPHGVTSIDAHGTVACAIVDGDAWCWGGRSGKTPKKMALRGKATAMGLSSSATCVATDASTDVFCSGSPTKYRTPVGTYDDISFGLDVTPKRLRDFSDAGVVGKVNAIAGGGGFGGDVALLIDGKIHVWFPLATERVTLTRSGGISAMAVGRNGICAIAQGAVWCWPDENKEPDAIKLPGPATQITAGSDHYCALVAGEAYCWGTRAYPAIGDGATCVPDYCWNSTIKYDGGRRCDEREEPCRQVEPKVVDLPNP